MWYNLNNLQLKLMAEHRDRMDHKTVNIFISSSFSDMHAERDYLVEYVFPRLREWCEKRRLYLNDIDLRWGVSLADSTAKNTIRVCLNNIDECRPFFLCFLGQRRGTVFGSDISVETYDEYPELKGMGDVYSATELEIEHALLSPMIRIVEERKERPEKARRALFFLRDDPFKDVDLSALHQKIYTNAGAADPEDAEKKHAAFRALVRESWDKVTSYQCRFDKDRKTPELRGFGEDGTSASPAENGRLVDFSSGGEPLSEVIIRQLKEMILSEYPDRRDESDDTSLTEEELQSMTRARLTQFFIRRKVEYDELQRYISSDNDAMLIVAASSGAGKSTLLAKLADETEDRRVIMRFCGISKDSMRFADVLRSVFESEGIPVPPDDESFLKETNPFFSELAAGGKTLLIFDDITRTAEGVSALKMLPETLPPNIRLIVSARETPDTARFIEAVSQTHHAGLMHISAFDREDKRRLIKDFLSRNLKRLDSEHIDYLCDLSATDNPLYLKIILKELKTFGVFEELRSEIERFGSVPEEAFFHFLDRLEQKVYNSFYEMRGASDYVFGLLSFARTGISKTDLHILMERRFGEGCDECLEYILKCTRDYLSGVIYTGGGSKVDFLYDSFKQAAQTRAGGEEMSLRSDLADVFEYSDPEECSYQLRMIGNTDRLRELYSEPEFITRFSVKSGGWRMMSESGLLPEGSISSELSDCLRVCVQALSVYPEKTPQILYKEIADSVFREKAKALIYGRWLRFEPAGDAVQQPQEDESDEELAPYLENRYNIDSKASVRCFSSGADLAFVMIRPGTISVFRMSTAELLYEMPVCDDISRITVTGDGKYFAAAGSDCSLKIYDLISSGSDFILRPVHEDECMKVRFKGMCVYAVDDAVIWQLRDRTLAAWQDDQLVELDGYDGQLTGAWKADGALLTTWKTLEGYCLCRGSAMLPLESAVNDVILRNGHLYIAVKDSVLYEVDPASLEVTKTVVTDNPLYSFAEYDGRLLATDEEYCLELISGDRKAVSLGNINFSNGSVNTTSFEYIRNCREGVFYCSDKVCAKLKLRAGEQTHAAERFFNAVKEEDRVRNFELFEGQYSRCEAEGITYVIENRRELAAYASDGRRLGEAVLDENLSGQYTLEALGRRAAVLTVRASIGSAIVRSVLEVYDGPRQLFRKEYHPDENIIGMYTNGGCIWLRGSTSYRIIDCDDRYVERVIPFDFTGFAPHSPVLITDHGPVMFRNSTYELCMVSEDSGEITVTYPMSRIVDSLERGSGDVLCCAAEHGTCAYNIYIEDE